MILLTSYILTSIEKNKILEENASLNFNEKEYSRIKTMLAVERKDRPTRGIENLLPIEYFLQLENIESKREWFAKAFKTSCEEYNSMKKKTEEEKIHKENKKSEITNVINNFNFRYLFFDFKNLEFVEKFSEMQTAAQKANISFKDHKINDKTIEILLNGPKVKTKKGKEGNCSKEEPKTEISGFTSTAIVNILNNYEMVETKPIQEETIIENIKEENIIDNDNDNDENFEYKPYSKNKDEYNNKNNTEFQNLKEELTEMKDVITVNEILQNRDKIENRCNALKLPNGIIKRINNILHKNANYECMKTCFKELANNLKLEFQIRNGRGDHRILKIGNVTIGLGEEHKDSRMKNAAIKGLVEILFSI